MSSTSSFPDLSQPVDHETEERKLLAEINSIYDRFRTGTLRPDDLVERDGETPPHWIAQTIRDRTNLQPDAAVFAHFNKGQGAILDIGAHWGYTALAMRLTGSDCPIVSIEASPANRACLAELRSWDSRYDFVIQPLGESPAQKRLYTPVVNGVHIDGLTNLDGSTFNDHYARLLASLVGKHIPYSKAYKVQISKIDVSVISLDDALRSHAFRVPVEPVAAIKLDVEQHELPVLKGASETLSKWRPFVMIEEANRNPPIVELLRDRGYVYADRDGDRVRLTNDVSQEVNGYWAHRDRLNEYRSAGLLVD